MLNILTVCTANICRSPTAELILQSQLRGDGASVSSAGTHARVGQPMSRLSAEIVKAYGVEEARVDAKAARPLVASQIANSDLILAMDRSHRRYIAELVPSSVRRVFTVREFYRLASSLGDEEFLNCSAAAIDEPRQRLNLMLDLTSSRRAAVLSPAAPGDDDVEDPYGRSEKTYVRSVEQTLPGLGQVERVIRLALKQI